jgi:outer membrane protein OmpA-like peptidoglycan-associated protein
MLHDIEVDLEEESPTAAPLVMPPLIITVWPLRVLDRFEFNKDSLRPFHVSLIRHVGVHVLGSWRKGRPIRTIRVVGHTDSTGRSPYNFNLGRRRALTVSRRLRMVIDKLSPRLSRRLRIVPQSLGATCPVAGSRTPQERALNRRVEVFVSTV